MKVLYATDGSRNARHARDLTLMLPLPKPRSARLVSVVPTAELNALREQAAPPEDQVLDDVRQRVFDDAEGLVAAEARAFRERGWTVATETCAGRPGVEVVRIAREHACELITLGAVGLNRDAPRGVGNNARQVLAGAEAPVLLGRPRRTGAASAENQVDIVVAYDGSPCAERALELLRGWALNDRITITLISVLTVSTHLFGLDFAQRTSRAWMAHRERLEESLQRAVVQLESAGARVSTSLLDGGERAGDELLDAIKVRDADLVVVGRSGKGAVQKFLLGSVAWRLCQSAPCSVLVVS